MNANSKKFPFCLPFKTYSARKRNGGISIYFPYHNIPKGFNPNIRIARFDDIWKAAKQWCEENGFSWDTTVVQSIAPV